MRQREQAARGQPRRGGSVCEPVDVVGFFSSRLPPFALLHGSSDLVVPVESSCKFSALLSGLAVKVSLYLLPGLNHTDMVTDLMAADRRYYHPIISCIRLEWRKLDLLHPRQLICS